MKLTEEQRAEYESLVTPLMEFLDRTCHPHTKIIIDSTHAELVEGVIGIPNRKYMREDESNG